MQADDLSSLHPVWIQNMILLPVSDRNDQPRLNVLALGILYYSPFSVSTDERNKHLTSIVEPFDTTIAKFEDV